MDTARIAGLLQPFLDRTLPEVQLDQISTYIDLLIRWNARVNLTAIRDPDEIVTRHFGESLFLARHLFPDPANFVTKVSPVASKACAALDIGSGAGFPGIPLKIWNPTVSLILVESNHKKAAFLREVGRALTLTNINVVTERAEKLPDSIPRQDIVTMRAVEHFDTILPTAAALVAPVGRLALLISFAQTTLLDSLDLQWSDPIPIPKSDSRVLTLGMRTTKVEQAPQ